jgi:hypothetical protein
MTCTMATANRMAAASSTIFSTSATVSAWTESSPHAEGYCSSWEDRGVAVEVPPRADPADMLVLMLSEMPPFFLPEAEWLFQVVEIRQGSGGPRTSSPAGIEATR